MDGCTLQYEGDIVVSSWFLFPNQPSQRESESYVEKSASERTSSYRKAWGKGRAKTVRDGVKPLSVTTSSIDGKARQDTIHSICKNSVCPVTTTSIPLEKKPSESSTDITKMDHHKCNFCPIVLHKKPEVNWYFCASCELYTRA